MSGASNCCAEHSMIILESNRLILQKKAYIIQRRFKEAILKCIVSV